MRSAQVQDSTRWRFSWLGLRHAVAMIAAGERALQRADVFEILVTRGDEENRLVAGC
jgi:hypothetical protein